MLHQTALELAAQEAKTAGSGKTMSLHVFDASAGKWRESKNLPAHVATQLRSTLVAFRAASIMGLLDDGPDVLLRAMQLAATTRGRASEKLLAIAKDHEEYKMDRLVNGLFGNIHEAKEQARKAT